MVNAINRHLKGKYFRREEEKKNFQSLDMVTFNEPTAGMFVWLKINDIEDTRKLIYEKALAQEVLFIPGNAFFPDQTKSYPFVRVSYSLSTPEQIDTVNISSSIIKMIQSSLFSS
jgi:DNA-binding transcriptional MocR family regulator